MVEGLKIEINYIDLQKHLQLRGDYHKKRADKKEVELPALKEALSRIDGAKNLTGSDVPQGQLDWLNETVGGSLVNYRIDAREIVGKLETDVRNHRSKARKFHFLAAHLIKEFYTLTGKEIEEWELTAEG